MMSLKRKWKHHDGDTYILIKAQAEGNDKNGFRIAHYSDTAPYDRLWAAKKNGLYIWGHDDFNIGVVNNGKLVAILWMDEDLREPPDVLTRIGSEIGL